MFAYLTKTLANGLRLVFVPTSAPTIVAQLWVGAGSKYETKKTRGLAHFMEHLAFKGTKKRPTALAIAQEMDRIGAAWNASTNKEKIAYWIKTTPAHLEFAFDLLSDIVFQPLLKTEGIDRERGVIIEELNMYQDTPMAKIEDLFEQTVLGDSPLGWEIIGTKETVSKLTRDDFILFQRRFFSPQNMVFAVAGGLKKNHWSKIVALAEKYLGSQPSWPVKKKKIKVKFSPQKRFCQEKETEQLHLIFGRPTFPLTDPRYYQMSLLRIILAGNTSSRLWQQIREKHGWAYYLYGFNQYFQETGLFGIKIGLAKNYLDQALVILKKEIDRLAQTLTEEELARAKDYWLGRLAIALEDPGYLAKQVASSWLLMGRLEKVEEAVTQVKKTSLKQLRQLAEEYFRADEFYLALIGPKNICYNQSQ